MSLLRRPPPTTRFVNSSFRLPLGRPRNRATLATVVPRFLAHSIGNTQPSPFDPPTPESQMREHSHRRRFRVAPALSKPEIHQDSAFSVSCLIGSPVGP